MLGQFDERAWLYDARRANQVHNWEYSLNHATTYPLSPENEHIEELIHEAARHNQIADLTRGYSRSGPTVLNLGALLVKLGCRLEKLGFGRLAPQQVRLGATVDCGCS